MSMIRPRREWKGADGAGVADGKGRGSVEEPAQGGADDGKRDDGVHMAEAAVMAEHDPSAPLAKADPRPAPSVVGKPRDPSLPSRNAAATVDDLAGKMGSLAFVPRSVKTGKGVKAAK